MAKEYINRLGQEKRERIFQAINNEVIVREAYLRTGYSAGELCRAHGFAPRDVSAVMALYYGENFASLLQRLRVNKVCKMLESPACQRKTCEMIGMRCGFSNRQSLYNAFCRIKGMTPQEYRKKIFEQQ
jgi:two-component system, response regulator YesN